ncbi:TIGR04211 family SH3 domain-containing protein [Salinisphaera hydrothermalis]|uniref:SH3 type 3 domain-containing protein n=1 Tax=Salinisphaera hydrothermalis (strain C41B8) TaxID=1304275 RepID=A0A084IKZ7_SALHC|nr:TIGR04211 family SH3 domain-containing protein [Salinisphaera hydrothermalis]KEZ77381.1 SH3 type 3 domain-containing protein [Salinisphaera hydrothermalis C41B8]
MLNRMTRRLVVASLLGTTLLFSVAASAATQYVSDQLSINMRSGPGTKYRIEKLLDAGDKLDTLGSSSNGWTRVRTSSGNTGYVLTRFLSDQPAARDQVADLKNQVNQLQSDNADLKKELAQALHGSDKLGELKRNLVDENKKLKSQLQNIRETSADAIRISKENEKYRKQLMSLRSDVDRLKHENQALQSRREGMKIGALILFGGILLGLLLPMFRRRRGKGSWDSL